MSSVLSFPFSLPLSHPLPLFRRTCASSLTVTKSLSPPRSLLCSCCDYSARTPSRSTCLSRLRRTKRVNGVYRQRQSRSADADATGPSEMRCPGHHRRSPHPQELLCFPRSAGAAWPAQACKPGSRPDIIPFPLKPLSPSLTPLFSGVPRWLQRIREAIQDMHKKRRFTLHSLSLTFVSEIVIYD